MAVNSVVSVNSLANQTLNVYPNPSSDVFNIDLNGIREASDVYILDPMGRVVKHEVIKTANPASLSIQVSDLNEGLYFLQVVTSEGRKVAPVVIKK